MEIDRAALVAGYVGQTAIKVTEVFDRADDGVVLIDEAYTLARGGERDFGRGGDRHHRQAHRGPLRPDRGHRRRYPQEMAEFIEANPGCDALPQTITSPTTPPTKPPLSFQRLGDKNHFHADDEAMACVRAFFDGQPRDRGSATPGSLATSSKRRSPATPAGSSPSSADRGAADHAGRADIPSTLDA